MSLEIIIWDVNHGNSTSIKLPTGPTVMLDCAANPITGFSPIWQTKKRWGYLDLLIVSHPHIDHISDIINIEEISPEELIFPEVSYKQLREGKYGEFKDIIEKYIEFTKKFTPDLPDPDYPNDNTTGDFEAEIKYFGLKGYQEDINNYSLVTFLTYGDFTFAYAGDLTSEGWENLIKQEGRQFTSLLKKTNFFEVAHHGRKEGYNPIIFEYMKDLKLAFVSDKHYQTTSITHTYAQYCKSWPVINENTDETMPRRKVLTTRSDGRIKIKVDLNEDDLNEDNTEVEVKTLNHNL